MREIEFRAKDLYGKWVYGFYSPRIWFPSLEQTPNIKTFTGSDIEIDVNTLGQYIGLKDKNGKKIYEGDLVRIIANDIEKELAFRVEYSNDTAQYEVFGNGLCITFDNIYNYEFEVISNIYDNPELLEEM